MFSAALGERSALGGLSGRSLLREIDVTLAEWAALLDAVAEVARASRRPQPSACLRGRRLALVAEQVVPPGQCPFEVAVQRVGADLVPVQTVSAIGEPADVAELARQLSQQYDGIVTRCSDHRVAEELARHAQVPVWNAWSSEWNPTHPLGDVVTMVTHAGRPAQEVVVAHVGNARTSSARSLLVAAAMTGLQVRVVAPPALQSPPDVAAGARIIAATTGASVIQTSEIATGVAGADYAFVEPERAQLVLRAEPGITLLQREPGLGGSGVTPLSPIVAEQLRNRVLAVATVLVATLRR